MPRARAGGPGARARWIVPLAIALVLTGPAASWARDAARVVVRYADTIDACMHCLLAHGSRVSTLTGTPTLDHLHHALGVRGATPVFFHHHARTGGRAAAWRAHTSAIRARFPARAARRTATRPPTSLAGIYVLDLPAGADVADAARQLAADPSVVWAEPEMTRTASYVPNDPYLATSGTWGLSYPDLWGLLAVGAPAAWDVTRGAGVVVAVVDTGIHPKHKDLAANVWRNPGEIPRNRIDDDGNGYVDDDMGWDFVGNRKKMKDGHGHGTHVAGTIAAVGDDGLGVAGLAWQARIMPVRGLDNHGSGRSTDLAKAIAYAADNGADVINNSWGGFGISWMIRDAIEAAADLGAVIVFAAGNDGRTGYVLGEAILPDVIAVTATNPTGTLASFSNWSEHVSVAAPGVDVLSTRGGGGAGGSKVQGKWVRLSGTSMAAPHVAGLAALLLADDPSLTQDEVRWHLELNADQPGYPGYEGEPFNPYFGWGQINAANAFTEPPVTTRLALRPGVLHGFAGTTLESTATLTARFTTESDPAWTLDGSPWIAGIPDAGAGDAEIAVIVDGTGHTPGTLTGAIGVAAPGTDDGGATLPITTHLHEDPRLGPEIEVIANTGSPNAPPVAASNGSTTLVVWTENGFRLRAALVGADGAVSAPIEIRDMECVGDACYRFVSNAIGVASDGTDFLVVFRRYIVEWDGGSRDTRTEYVNAVRMSASGQVLDATPIVLASQIQTSGHSQSNFDRYFGNIRPTWDGAAYAVLWAVGDENGNNTDRSTVHVRRVGATGELLGDPVHVYPTPTTPVWQIVFPTIACAAPDDCLVTWIEWNGLPAEAGTGFVRNALAVRVAGGQVVTSPPAVVLEQCDYNDLEAIRIVAHPSGYGILALRRSCPTPLACGYDLYGALAAADGTPVDPAGFRLNEPPGPGLAWARPVALAFDGTQFLAAFLDLRVIEPVDLAQWWDDSASSGYPIFGARFLPDGTVLDSEPIGRLLQPRRTAVGGRLVTTDTSFMLVWHDTRYAPPGSNRAVYAQRLFPR